MCLILFLLFSLAFQASYASSKYVSPTEEPGLIGFNLRLDQFWGVGERAQADLKLISPTSYQVLGDLIAGDMTIKTALDNYGMFAYTKALNHEAWDTDFEDEFADCFNGANLLLNKTTQAILETGDTCAFRATKLAIERYVRIYYGLGVKKVARK
jgi:hypothetical protein